MAIRFILFRQRELIEIDLHFFFTTTFTGSPARAIAGAETTAQSPGAMKFPVHHDSHVVSSFLFGESDLASL